MDLKSITRDELADLFRRGQKAAERQEREAEQRRRVAECEAVKAEPDASR